MNEWQLYPWNTYAGPDIPEKTIEPSELYELLVGPNQPQGPSNFSLVFEMDSSWKLTWGAGELGMRRGMFTYAEEEETIEGVDLLWDPDGNPESIENVKLDGGGDAGSQLSFEIHAEKNLYFNLTSYCWE